jgi:GTP-binding protein EngB required for normal cell division
MRGPGETSPTVVSYVIAFRYSKTKSKLLTNKWRATQQPWCDGSCSLVGYTNVGKSTLMNAVGKSDVFVENKTLCNARYYCTKSGYQKPAFPAFGYRRIHQENCLRSW